MNFDLDDPLGDLLSDGSSDSFFESKKKPTKSTTKTPTKSVTPQRDRSKLKDLFDLVQDDPPASAPPPPPVTPFQSQSSFQAQKSIEITQIKETPKKEETPKKSETGKSSTTKKETAFDMDSDEIDLGFNLKNLKTKTGILDDILGIEVTKKKEPIQSVVKPKPVSNPITKSETRESIASTSKPGSRQFAQDGSKGTVDSLTSYGGYAPSIGRGSSGRRGSTTKLNDPLGLFSDNIEPPKATETKKPQSDWLGLNQTEETPNLKKTDHSFEQPKIIEVSQIKSTPIEDVTINATNLLSFSNRENENSMLELKRQESQLILAAQVKNQENVLFDMQKRQQQLLAQQEFQFNELLQKQLQRQQIIEENIKNQQQRISSHIQMLLNQPPMGTTIAYDTDQKQSDLSPKETTASVEIEVEVKRLELEKLRLEDLLANINVNHEQEITFLEKSYKKQIEMLSETTANLEQRMKTDVESLESYYDRKIKLIEMEKDRVDQEHEKMLTTTVEQYENTIKKIKSHHETEIEEIRAEHRKMIENIRQSKLLEFSIVQENNSYLSTLKNASKYLENATGDLQNLRENIQETLDHEYTERKKQIESREKYLTEQQIKFEKSKTESNEEKKRLLELITTLELKLDSVTRMASEEEWRFKQKLSSLDVERAGFEREQSFFREQLKLEQKNVEDLKRFQAIEFQKKIEQIEEQKLYILTEKSKLETLSRVQKPPNPELSRVEIEAAINVAQDAARQSDLERERLMDMQRKCEIQKRDLINKENGIRGKELELDCAINLARDREKNVQNIIKATKLAEDKVKAKLQYLKNLSQDLSHRESMLAKEKLGISQERIDLQELRKKMYESRCSLCKISDQRPELTNILSMDKVYPTSDNDECGQFDLDKFDVDRLDMMLDREVEQSMKKITKVKSYEIDLNEIPNITDMDDEILDPQLLLLKWDTEMNRDVQ